MGIHGNKLQMAIFYRVNMDQRICSLWEENVCTAPVVY